MKLHDSRSDEDSLILRSGLSYDDLRDRELIYESDSGYCRIFKAVNDGRLVILKTLREKYRDSEFYRRLLRKEFDIAGKLYDRHIPAVYSLKDIPGLGEAIEMEYIDGVTLREFLDGRRLDKRETFSILEQICAALSYLHSRQIVHLDLKPENIMVTRQGLHVKLIDFGLSDSSAYVSGKIVGGTRRYSAPELFTPGCQIDNRVDIYALGVIMDDLWPDAPGYYKRASSMCRSVDKEKRPADASEVYKMIDRKGKSALKITILLFTLLISVVAGIILLKNDPDAEIVLDHTANYDEIIDYAERYTNEVIDKAISQMDEEQDFPDYSAYDILSHIDRYVLAHSGLTGQKLESARAAAKESSLTRMRQRNVQLIEEFSKKKDDHSICHGHPNKY